MELPAIPRETYAAPVRAVTRGQPHFFGYFDKTPWSADGRRLLACRAEFQDRPPTADDVLTLGTIDLERDDAFEPFAETRAWCWQQGTMLQWLPGTTSRVVYNVRRDDETIVGVVHDLADGSTRELDRPIYALSPRGDEALSLNFRRIQTCRPGYGYPPALALDDPVTHAPDDDGIWRVDLATGRAELVVSLAELAAARPDPRIDGVPQYLNHATYNTDGSRITFFHITLASVWFDDQLMRWFTANPDGSARFELPAVDILSRYDWRDPQTIAAWAFARDEVARDHDPFRNWYRWHDGIGAYFTFRDGSDQAERFGVGVIPHDGHCTFSPDRRWLLTDESARLPGNEADRPLILYEVATGRRVDVARFAEPLDGELRCDLHPRWSRDGRQVCVDSATSGTRQMCVVDVAPVVDGT